MANSSRQWSDVKNWVMGIVGGLLVLLIAWGTSQMFDSPPPKPGVVLKQAVKAGTPLTSEVVTIGPSDGSFPETAADLDEQLCAARDLPKGTRLTLDNLRFC